MSRSAAALAVAALAASLHVPTAASVQADAPCRPDRVTVPAELCNAFALLRHARTRRDVVPFQGLRLENLARIEAEHELLWSESRRLSYGDPRRRKVFVVPGRRSSCLVSILRYSNGVGWTASCDVNRRVVLRGLIELTRCDPTLADPERHLLVLVMPDGVDAAVLFVHGRARGRRLSLPESHAVEALSRGDHLRKVTFNGMRQPPPRDIRFERTSCRSDPRSGH